MGPLPNGLFLAYEWGPILTTYPRDDPPSTSVSMEVGNDR